MKKIAAVGMGNVLMRDDAIGVRVLEAIKQKLNDAGILTLVCETDFGCCFDIISNDSFLFIIDSMCKGAAPGTVEAFTLSDVLKGRKKGGSLHEFGLLDLICTHYPDTKGVLIGIEAAEIAMGFGLSAELKGRFEYICAEVSEIIIEARSDICARHAAD